MHRFVFLFWRGSGNTGRPSTDRSAITTHLMGDRRALPASHRTTLSIRGPKG